MEALAGYSVALPLFDTLSVSRWPPTVRLLIPQPVFVLGGHAVCLLIRRLAPSSGAGA